MKNENTPSSSLQEQYVLDAITEIRKLIFYKLSSFHRDSFDDILHRIFYKLWSWKTRYEKTLEYEEWRKVTKTAACREINQFFFGKIYERHTLFADENRFVSDALYD